MLGQPPPGNPQELTSKHRADELFPRRLSHGRTATFTQRGVRSDDAVHQLHGSERFSPAPEIESSVAQARPSLRTDAFWKRDTGFGDEGYDFHLRSAGTQKRVHLQDLTEQARPGSPPAGRASKTRILARPRRACFVTRRGRWFQVPVDPGVGFGPAGPVLTQRLRPALRRPFRAAGSRSPRRARAPGWPRRPFRCGRPQRRSASEAPWPIPCKLRRPGCMRSPSLPAC